MTRITSISNQGSKIPVGLAVGRNFNSNQLFNPQAHFSASFANSLRSQDLKEISATILFDRAIELIGDGVAAMPWTVNVPLDRKDDPEAHKYAEKLAEALSEPNQDQQDTYTKFIKAIVRDILVFGSAAIERQAGIDKKSQPFWLWVARIEDIALDPDWEASREGIHPRYWYLQHEGREDPRPIMSRNMFLIQTKSSSYDLVPSSPVKIAFQDMVTWLKLHGYQARTISQAIRDYMICLEDASDQDLEDFRNYWRDHVVGLGEIPIFSGKVNIQKFGARNDSELYLQAKEQLTCLLGLAFGVSRRDFGLTDHDNKATANVASDHTFQYAILPLAKAIFECLRYKVFRYYAPGYSIELADIEPRKEGDEADTAVKVYGEGLITKNEGRARIGEKPIQGGDTFKGEKEEEATDENALKNEDGARKESEDDQKANQLKLF